MKNDADGKIISREEFGKGNLKKICDCLSKTFDKGNVLVVFDERSSNVSDDVVRYLLKGGYFVRTAKTHGKAEELPAVDECVKYIVGVGGGGVADDARLLAKRQSVGYSIVITAPDNDNFASDGAYILNEYVYTARPISSLSTRKSLKNRRALKRRRAMAGRFRVLSGCLTRTSKSLCLRVILTNPP